MPFTHDGVEEEFPTATQHFSDSAIERIESDILQSRPPGHFDSSPDDVDAFSEWVEQYLKGESDTGTHSAHQFTLNHVTFPFVRDLNFAAVPYPPPVSSSSGEITKQSLNRPLEIPAALYSVSPGDLMFFYKSDAQVEDTGDFGLYNSKFEERRGILGVYRALSEPFLDPTNITDDRTGYTLAGSCDKCGAMYSPMRGADEEGPDSSGIEEYWCSGSSLYDTTHGHHQNENQKPGSLTLAPSIDLEPLLSFRIPVGDNHAYSTLGGNCVIWTGRNDNVRGGEGSGSSIRHLMPEEAVKLTRLLVEASETLSPYEPESYTPVERDDKADYRGSEVVLPLTHETGVPIHNPRIEYNDDELQSRSWWEVYGEKFLHLYMSWATGRDSQFMRQMGGFAGFEIEEALSNLEFYGIEFPWGFANDQADFVCTFSEGDERSHIIVVENKMGRVNKKAIVELMLYIPWVARTLGRYARPTPEELTVTPVMVGAGTKRTFRLTNAYEFEISSISARCSIDVHVEDSRFLRYRPDMDTRFTLDGKEYTEDLIFDDESSELVGDSSSITRENWPSGFSVLSATENEKNRVKDIWPLDTESQSGLEEFLSEPD
jgi:hypothetical protein